VNELYLIFGRNLSNLRKSRKLTQVVLAEMANCHPNYIGGIERGERNPSLRNIISISNALDCDIAELFKGIKSDQL
jgi:transcriptional regulator with XRE-family HTH domain